MFDITQGNPAQLRRRRLRDIRDTILLSWKEDKGIEYKKFIIEIVRREEVSKMTAVQLLDDAMFQVDAEIEMHNGKDIIVKCLKHKNGVRFNGSKFELG